MANLKTIAPFEIFKEIVASIKTISIVTDIDQVNGLTTLFCNTSKINISNYVTIDCGDLNGEFQVKEVYNDRFVIRYSGNYSNGTVETYPYFDWGNLKDGKLEIHKRHEYPLIFMILPDAFEVNLDDADLFYIKNQIFKFLVVDKFNEVNLASEKTKTEHIYNSCVKSAAEISDRFADATRNYKYIHRKSFNYKRSDQIPFGITITSNENGKTESLFEANTAGCYLEIRVNIYKQYNC